MPRRQLMNKTRPLLVIGVSGVGWDLLDRQIAAGDMPHLGSIVQRGASAPLLSERVAGDQHYRPQVAWASLATGCSAARHGVTRFFHEGCDLRERTMWDYWQEAGLSVGVFGWPGTWPPRPTRGFVAPSHFARDQQTWPRELCHIKTLDRIQQDREREPTLAGHARSAAALGSVIVRHRLRPGSALRLAEAAARAAVAAPNERRLLLRRAKLDLMTDVFRSLVERHRPDLAAFVTFYVDLALHRFWREWQPHLFSPAPTTRAGRLAIPQALRDLDRAIGRLLGLCRADSVVAFVSEHGMAPEPSPREVGAVYYAIRGERVAELIGESEALRPVAIARWVAYRPGPGRRRLPSDLAARLRLVTVVESDLPLFNVYEHGSDEVVVKLSLPLGVPAYTDRPLTELRVRFGDRVVPFASLTRPVGHTRSAMHSKRAAFAIAGPGIAGDLRLGDASLVDVLPTLAAACGLELPQGLDGRCLDVFS
jgi:arylsulfatase A-like enzyme